MEGRDACSLEWTVQARMPKVDHCYLPRGLVTGLAAYARLAAFCDRSKPLVAANSTRTVTKKNQPKTTTRRPPITLQKHSKKILAVPSYGRVNVCLRQRGVLPSRAARRLKPLSKHLVALPLASGLPILIPSRCYDIKRPPPFRVFRFPFQKELHCKMQFSSVFEIPRSHKKQSHGSTCQQAKAGQKTKHNKHFGVRAR